MYFDKKVLVVVGDRPKELGLGYERSNYIDIYSNIKKEIERNIQQYGCEVVITSLSQGIEQIAFWATQQLKEKYNYLENVVILPYANQAERWAKGEVENGKTNNVKGCLTKSNYNILDIQNKYSLFGQEEYELIVEKADNILIVERKEIKDAKLIATSVNDKNKALVQFAERMLVVSNLDISDVRNLNFNISQYFQAKGNDIECLNLQLASTTLHKGKVQIYEAMDLGDLESAEPFENGYKESDDFDYSKYKMETGGDDYVENIGFEKVYNDKNDERFEVYVDKIENKEISEDFSDFKIVDGDFEEDFEF